MDIDFKVRKVNPPAALEVMSEEMVASNPIALPSNASCIAAIEASHANNNEPWITGRARRDCSTSLYMRQ